jgi:hypothetical protein
MELSPAEKWSTLYATGSAACAGAAKAADKAMRAQILGIVKRMRVGLR